LGKEWGNLTEGNLMTMDIQDDVATLRSEFSGIWALLHFVAIAFFFTPYIWFLIQHRIEASFTKIDHASSMTLMTALGRYIYNGGVDWRTKWDLNFYSLIPFIVFLIYNIIRILLLYKTKTLETKQEVSNLPAMFSFEEEPRWANMLKAAKIGVFIYLICAVINVIYFMQMRIPIEPLK
jgi:hypothetical protein